MKERNGLNSGNNKIIDFNKKKYKILIPLVALFVSGMFIFFERNGILQRYEQNHLFENHYSEKFEQEVETLVLYDSKSTISNILIEQVEFVLSDMKVGYQIIDLEKDKFLATDLVNYNNVVIATDYWTKIGEEVFDLCNWIDAGGNVMVACTPDVGGLFGAVAQRFGVNRIGNGYVNTEGLWVNSGAMVGASEDTYFQLIDEDEYLDAVLSVQTVDDCEIIATLQNKTTPVIWRRNVGEGTISFLNSFLIDKYQRGFIAVTYSLLDDINIYPVINGSTYYLDDFPSPVPGGESKYIEEDYGISIASFYSTVWWPRVLTWEEKYGIVHTGVMIEDYSDIVEGDFKSTQDLNQFLYFGNMLLNHGGELGYHGYNHQPLCLEGIDDDRQYGSYNLWPNEEEMKKALTELERFSRELYSNRIFSVYVPPSNIMSDIGKKILTDTLGDIKVLASTYSGAYDEPAYVQEFSVDESGIIHTPRITSGCDIDYYQKLQALAELNFHYVQNHFMHPDDVLDEDRGAALGWEYLSKSFEDNYLDWIKASAPSIRNLTGSELGSATEKYCNLSVKREYLDDGIRLKLGGFSDEAYFICRVNDKEIIDTVGCEYELITGDIYLIHATNNELTIYTGAK